MSIKKDNKLFFHEEMLERIVMFKKKLSFLNININEVKGLSPAAIHRYRLQGNIPKGDTLEEWGTKYDLSIDWLLWGKGEMLQSDNAVVQEASKGNAVKKLEVELYKCKDENLRLAKELIEAKDAVLQAKEEILHLYRMLHAKESS